MYLQQEYYEIKQDDAGKVLSTSFDNKHSVSEVDTIYCFLFYNQGSWGLEMKNNLLNVTQVESGSTRL